MTSSRTRTAAEIRPGDKVSGSLARGVRDAYPITSGLYKGMIYIDWERIANQPDWRIYPAGYVFTMAEDSP